MRDEGQSPPAAVQGEVGREARIFAASQQRCGGGAKDSSVQVRASGRLRLRLLRVADGPHLGQQAALHA